MSSQRKVPEYWFGSGTPPLHARLLATAYARVVALRRRLFDRGTLKRQHVGVPVVVIGNLTVGGTGKTPLTIALVQRLAAAGFRPGVASRGYGRDDEATAMWVERNTPARAGGDEPVLIALRTGVPVRVDRDRVAAARELVARGCDVVVCDDGLQHYRLARDIEIEVIDGRRRYGNGWMLPAGPLREPAERAARCDFRVLNLGVGSADGANQQAGLPAFGCCQAFGEWPMYLHSASAQLIRGGRVQPLAGFTGQRVHAVAGIGNPQRFFDSLRHQGIGVVPHAFADHHRYVAADFAFGSELPVLMTEKDAVKCHEFAGDQSYSVPIDARLPEAFWAALIDRVATRIRKP